LILYTLAPLAETVFSPPELENLPDVPEALTCSISGGLVQGVKTSKGMRVTRVISTDPKTYLSKGFDLGAEVPIPSFGYQQRKSPGAGIKYR